MIKHIKVQGLNKVFNKNLEFTSGATALGVDSNSILFITCTSDDTSIDPKFKEGSNWIWAKGEFFDGSDIDFVGGKNYIPNSSSIIANQHFSPDITLENNQTYTLSCKEIIRHNSEYVRVAISISGASYKRLINDWDGSPLTFSTSGGYNKIYFYGGANTSQSAEFKYVKLEKGLIATDWTPSPEDIKITFQSGNIGTDLINFTEKTGISGSLGCYGGTVNAGNGISFSGTLGNLFINVTPAYSESIGAVALGYSETATNYPLKTNLHNKAYVDLSSLQTIGGRNLAIQSTVINSNAINKGNNRWVQQTADTRGFMLQAYTQDTIVSSNGTQVIFNNIPISTIGIYKATIKLTSSTQYIRIKHNGATVDGPDLIFTLPYIIKAGTWITVSCNVENITQGQFTLKDIKIEEGKVATTFTLAPEDIRVGGKNLISKNWRNYVSGYQGATLTKTTINSVPEFVGCDATNSALQLQTIGGTSTLKTYMHIMSATSYKVDFDIVTSVYVKNIGTTSIFVRDHFAISKHPYDYQVEVKPQSVKRVIISGRQESEWDMQLVFYTATASESTNFIIWRPQVQIGNVATEWMPPSEELYSYLYAGSGTASNSATTNGNTKLTIADTAVRSSIGVVGSGATTVSSDTSGKITINSTDTTYSFSNGSNGNFTVTPSEGSTETISIGKPSTAGTADKVANSLTLKGEDTTVATYNGSAAKTVTISGTTGISVTGTTSGNINIGIDNIGGQNLLAGSAFMMIGNPETQLNSSWSSKSWRVSTGGGGTGYFNHYGYHYGYPIQGVKGILAITHTGTSGAFGCVQDALPISIKENTTFTYSIWAKAVSGTCMVQLCPMYSQAQAADIVPRSTQIPVGTTWQRLTYTASSGNKSANQLENLCSGYVYNCTPNSTLYVCAPKLEYGEVATDWCPNPDDDFSYGKNLWEDSTFITQNVTGYSGSTVTVTKNQIVSEWGCNDAVKLVSTGGTTTIKIIINKNTYLPELNTYNNIATTSIYVKNNGTANVVCVEHSLNTNRQIVRPGEVTRVVLSGVYGKNYNPASGSYDNGTLRHIQFHTLNASDNVNVTIWHPQIEIGTIATDWKPAEGEEYLSINNGSLSPGDNLLYGTKEFFVSSNSAINQGASYSTATEFLPGRKYGYCTEAGNIQTEKYNGFTVRRRTITGANTVASEYILKDDNIAPNTYYTISFYARTNISSLDNWNLYFYNDIEQGVYSIDKSSNLKFYNNSIGNGNAKLNVTTDWQKYWAVYKTGPTCTQRTFLIRSVNNSTATGWIDICGCKIEKGCTVTEWTPHFADSKLTKETMQPWRESFYPHTTWDPHGGTGLNKWAFLPPNFYDIEYSTDSGSNWTAFDKTEPRFIYFLSKAHNSQSYGYILGNRTYVSSGNYNSTSDQLRVTVNTSTSAPFYCTIQGVYIQTSYQPMGSLDVIVEYNTYNNATWQSGGTYQLVGQSGGTYVPIIVSQNAFGSFSDNTPNIKSLRFTFKVTAAGRGYIYSMQLFGAGVPWKVLSNLSNTGHLYDYDYQQNATFPANINATKFIKDKNSTNVLLANGDTKAFGEGITNGTNISLSMATSTTLGGVKLGSDTRQSVAANSVSSTANRTYAVQKNSSNQLVVNVPWSDSNTDTKVTQSPTSANVNYNILTTTANKTSSVTDTANFSTKLTYNPGTSTLKNDGCSQVYDSTNKCLKFVFS